MEDNQVQQNTVATPQTTPQTEGMTDSILGLPLMQRLASDLIGAGMSEESVGYILSRIATRISTQVLTDAGEVVGTDTINQLNTITNDQEKITFLDQAFHAKKGMTLFQYRDHLAEQMIAEYDALT